MKELLTANWPECGWIQGTGAADSPGNQVVQLREDDSPPCEAPADSIGWQRHNLRWSLSCCGQGLVPEDHAVLPDLPPWWFHCLLKRVHSITQITGQNILRPVFFLLQFLSSPIFFSSFHSSCFCSNHFMVLQYRFWRLVMPCCNKL